MDGIAAIRQIQQSHPKTRIIVVTSHHQDDYIFPTVRAGAISYLLKDVEPDELVAAIRKAAEGGAMRDSRVAARIIQELQGICKDEVNPFTELSEREFEVLRLIAAGKSNVEIATDLVISENTMKTHIGNILKKQHLDDAHRLPSTPGKRASCSVGKGRFEPTTLFVATTWSPNQPPPAQWKQTPIPPKKSPSRCPRKT